MLYLCAKVIYSLVFLPTWVTMIFVTLRLEKNRQNWLAKQE